MYESIILTKNFEAERSCDQLNCRYNEDGVCANADWDEIFNLIHQTENEYELIPTVCEISDIDEDICGLCGERYVNSKEHSEYFGRPVRENIKGECGC
jgi:hypothetical protein